MGGEGSRLSKHEVLKNTNLLTMALFQNVVIEVALIPR